nr:reverse transcriptase domain-containing protein [uncultured Oscillibacter sp.]
MIVYREAASLARDLGVEVRTLYALSNSLPAHYHTVEIPKKDGGVRRLTVPDEALKRVQRAILHRLLVHMPVSPCAAAYRFGGGAVRGAARHVGSRQVLRLDIQHFFDSVRYSAVKDAVFPPEIFSEPLRVLLTMLCYYRDSLPQGAPTSPAIVNILLRDFDRRVGAWCRAREITYTRYCDDLTFSGEDLTGVRPMAEAELRALGFFLNNHKTRLRSAGRRQTVTGLVVNEKVSVPREKRRAIRQAVYCCRRFGVEGHLERTGETLSPEVCLDRLLGQVGYVLQADPGCAWAPEARRWLLGERRRRK